MNISDKILCVGLRTSCLGTTAQDREATAEVVAKYGATTGNMAVTKTILRDALKPAKQRRAKARTWFNSVTLPGISEDLRITTPARLVEIRERIDQFRKEDQEGVDNVLIPNYEVYKDADRPRLGTAYDPNLYPDPLDLQSHFDILLTTTDMPSGDYARIQGLTASAQAKMQEDHQKMLQQIGTAAKNEVMKKLAELVGHIAEKLSNPNAEKFFESTFGNLKDYLAMVPDLNITNDPTLESIRREAVEKLDFSMKQVKDSAFLKEQAAAAAKNLLSRFGAQGGNRKLLI